MREFGNYRHPGPRREVPWARPAGCGPFPADPVDPDHISKRLRFDGIRMQNASAALQNSFHDGHPNIGKPKENLRKTKVFSL